MAATTDIILDDRIGEDHTFTPTVAVPNGYEYRDLYAATAEPVTLRVTHNIAAPSSIANSKCGIRFTRARANSAGAMRTGYIDVVISAPKDGVTDTNMLDLVNFVRHFLTDANLPLLLLGKY